MYWYVPVAGSTGKGVEGILMSYDGICMSSV
jgi:hypothetical protein